MLPTSEEAQIDADRALEELYAAHYLALVRLAVLLVRDQAAAEDVVQDAYVALYRRWGAIEEAKAAAYLRRSVVNGARSALRRRGVAQRHRPDPVGSAPAADQSPLVRERHDAVIAALAGLSRRQREVIVLRYYLDLSEREIAATLGISAGAVKSHAARGAAALRERLAGQEES